MAYIKLHRAIPFSNADCNAVVSMQNAPSSYIVAILCCCTRLSLCDLKSCVRLIFLRIACRSKNCNRPREEEFSDFLTRPIATREIVQNSSEAEPSKCQIDFEYKDLLFSVKIVVKYKRYYRWAHFARSNSICSLFAPNSLLRHESINGT